MLWVIVIREAYPDLLETAQEHHEALAFRSVDVLDHFARDVALAKERSQSRLLQIFGVKACFQHDC